MSTPDNNRQPAKKRFRRDRLKHLLTDILLWVILLIFFVPALWIILTSFRIRNEINAFPPIWIPSGFTLDSYKILFGMPTPEGAFDMGGAMPVPSYARNSVVIATVDGWLCFFTLQVQR
jgi:ABC-type glycerol-3-phosphate transport system permease component